MIVTRGLGRDSVDYSVPIVTFGLGRNISSAPRPLSKVLIPGEWSWMDSEEKRIQDEEEFLILTSLLL